MNQTVAECLTAATDSVTLITDINTNGLRSVYVGGKQQTQIQICHKMIKRFSTT